MSSSSLRLHVLALRLTPGERATLAGRAGVAGVPPSTYVRRTAIAHRVRGAGSRLTRADVEELVALGIELNDLAHAANTLRRIVAPDELTSLLARIRTKASQLSARLTA